MRLNFEPALAFGQRPDFDGGGLHDSPGDSGGWTCRGITLATFRGFCARHQRRRPSVADLGRISQADVEAIYREGFWDPVHGDDLPAGVDLCAFDFANGSGPVTSIRVLQAAAGAVPDGLFGPRTLAAVLDTDPDVLIDRLTHRDEEFYAQCAGAGLFLRGWDRRTVARCAVAHALAAAWRAAEALPAV
jgi:lysozyme family protein